MAARHHVHRGEIGTLLVIASSVVLLAARDAHGVPVLAVLVVGYLLGGSRAMDGAAEESVLVANHAGSELTRLT